MIVTKTLFDSDLRSIIRKTPGMTATITALKE